MVIAVRFLYLTGIKRRMVRKPRLAGSWNGWAEVPMVEMTARRRLSGPHRDGGLP